MVVYRNTLLLTVTHRNVRVGHPAAQIPRKIADPNSDRGDTAAKHDFFAPPRHVDQISQPAVRGQKFTRSNQ